MAMEMRFIAERNHGQAGARDEMIDRASMVRDAMRPKRALANGTAAVPAAARRRAALEAVFGEPRVRSVDTESGDLTEPVPDVLGGPAALASACESAMEAWVGAYVMVSLLLLHYYYCCYWAALLLRPHCTPADMLPLLLPYYSYTTTTNELTT